MINYYYYTRILYAIQCNSLSGVYASNMQEENKPDIHQNKLRSHFQNPDRVNYITFLMTCWVL